MKEIKRKFSKADYAFSRAPTENIILIIDSDLGNTSVTNDIENVVKEISIHLAINPVEYKWVYCDSMRVWDGWNPKTNSFIPLRCTGDPDEVIKLINGHWQQQMN